MRTRPILLLLATNACLLVTGPIGLPAIAADDDEDKPLVDWNFDQPLAPDDPEAAVLVLGDNGPWSANIADGQYRVQNHQDGDAVRYVHLGLSDAADKPVDLRGSWVDVDVEGNFQDPDSGAGILYRFDPEKKTYLAFVVTKGGWQILKRDENGLSTVSQGDLSRDGPASLEVHANESGKVAFSVDDEVVGSVESGNIQGNDIGMIAIGRGDFDFDNFQVYPSDDE